MQNIIKKIGYLIVALTLLYLLLGFLFFAQPLGKLLTEQVRSKTGLSLSFDDISFNPLFFSVELKEVNISDLQNQKFFSAKKAQSNFNPSQLLFKQYSFSYIRINEPELNLKLNSELKFDQPLIKFTPNNEENTKAIDLLIEQIRIEKGSATISAGAFSQDIQINDLDFIINQFNLSDIGSEFKLNISTPQNEKITLNGEYNHKQQSLTSDFTLDDIQSQTISSFLPPDLATSLTDGNINSEGKLTWPMVSLPEFEFDWLKWSELSAHWSENGEINQLFVAGEGIKIDLNNQQIQVKNINIKNGKVNINWPWLQNETTSPPASPSNPWHYDIEQMTLSEIPIKLTDKSLAAEISQSISTASIQNLSNKASSSDFSLLLDNPPNGTIQASGSIKILEEPEIQAVLDIKNLMLKPFSPWFENSTQFQLTNGTLSAQQKFRFINQNWQTAGQIKLSNIQVKDITKHDLIKVGTLDVAQSLITSHNKNILLNQITLDRANGFIPHTIQRNKQDSEHYPDDDWRVTLGEIQPPE